MRVLLSIKPKYVEQIFAGNKLFEYRKVIFKKNIDTIVIYETKPIGKIVGELKISRIYKDSPEQIWNKTSTYSDISKGDFFQYFRGKEVAYAIEFKKVIKYNKPIDIKGYPPQSYKYI